MSQNANEPIAIDKIGSYIAHAELTGSSLFLTGPSGIGKSEFVETLATQSGRLCCTKIMAAMGTEDVGMAAVPKDSTVFIRFLMNEGFPFVGTESIWLHSQTGKAPFLFLDEANNALPYMQNLELQLVGEKKVHGIPLIKGTIIIAAGNRIEDAAHISKLSGPLANRFIHLDVDKPTVAGFKDYCVRMNVNPFLPAYIDAHPEHLHVWNADQFLIHKAFATPRQWVRHVGPILDNPNLSDEERINLVGGSVGFGIGTDVETFYRLRHELPDLDAICAKGEGKIPKNVSTRLLLIVALVRKATTQNLGNLFKYISQLASSDPEWADLWEKNLFLRFPAFAGHPAYTRWALSSNRQPITNALAQEAIAAKLFTTLPTAATPIPEAPQQARQTGNVVVPAPTPPPAGIFKRRI